jgi:rhodanese-related sulfurtransferase
MLQLSELRKAAKDPAVQQKVDKALPKQQIIYCHCGSGVRVLMATSILSKLGYDIRPLADGYDDLVAAGFKPAKK